MEFYITLPSNSGDNTTSDFRVQLPDTIRLSGNWVVALAEIQYTYSWYNVKGFDPKTKKGDNEIMVYLTDNHALMTIVPEGYYSNGADICKAIKVGLTDNTMIVPDHLNPNAHLISKKHQIEIKDGILLDSMRFEYDEVLKHISLKILKPEIVRSVRLSDHLRYMMGFSEEFLTPGQMRNNKKKIDPVIPATYPPDMRAGVDSIFVYCDIIENQIVGNVKAQLLRTVPVKGKYGEIIDRVFTAEHYVPVLNKEFSSIEILIKDDLYRSIPFRFGKSVVKLHFKKEKEK